MFSKPPSPPITITSELNTDQLFEQMGQNTPLLSNRLSRNYPGHAERSSSEIIEQITFNRILYNCLDNLFSDRIGGTGTQEKTTTPQQPNLIITPELRYISRQLKSIKVDTTKILNFIKPQINFKFDLPIQTSEQLRATNKKLLDDEEFSSNLAKYLSSYAPIDGKHSFTGPSKIITEELLSRYNWDGLHLKMPITDMVLFKKNLFDAWKDKFLLYKDYETSIKKTKFSMPIIGKTGGKVVLGKQLRFSVDLIYFMNSNNIAVFWK